MANIEWTEFRPRGLFSESTPVVVTEGAIPVIESDVVDEIGLPAGYYKIDIGIQWLGNTGTHLDLKFRVNGSDSQLYRIEVIHGDPIVNTSHTGVYLPVLAGALAIDLIYEFPDQGGIADSTILQRQVSWEKWSEFPVA